MTVDEVVSEALFDRVFYEHSGGGVTLSGGEVLSQAAFARQVLSHLKDEGIHTLVETSGFGREEALLSLAAVTDLFYFDFKLADSGLFRRFTGGDPDIVMRNLKALRTVTDQIVLRIPLIPGITDTIKNVAAGFALACDLGIQSVHLLPYNASAGAKYAWLGLEYPLGLLETRQGLYEKLFALAPPELVVEIMT
jgi:pyruvate formate lyase activating enzyme